MNNDRVFLNVPYDRQFKNLYIAYIVGLTELGLTPTATLAIPGGEARLDRIFDLIQSCRYSVHDLSRVTLDRKPPPTPRFNMPFELGMAVAWAKQNPDHHTYIVCEAVKRRAQKSLSDMAGSDFNIHDNTPLGVMRELCNAFVRQEERPTVPRMMRRYETICKLLPKRILFIKNIIWRTTVKYFRFCLMSLQLIITLDLYASSLHAQTTSDVSQSEFISASIALEKDHVEFGKSPLVLLTVKNLTDHKVHVHGSPHYYIIHVEGQKGEPPTTLLQRRVTGKLLPGESYERGDEVMVVIMPGESKLLQFSLSQYYNFTFTGRYSVYLDVYDESGRWIRTNTVQFELQGASTPDGAQ